LRDVEFRIVAIRDVEAAREPIPGEYNLEHLKDVHRHLFRDLYDWAGETRTVDIAKPGARFAHFRYIDDEVAAILRGLPDEFYLLGLKSEPFVERLAHYYGELNARHPFREGNGRTNRAFLRQLAAAAGWRIDWSELDAEDNVRACHLNLQTGETDELVRVLRPLLSRS
jgi:cell filamentation protein